MINEGEKQHTADSEEVPAEQTSEAQEQVVALAPQVDDTAATEEAPAEPSVASKAEEEEEEEEETSVLPPLPPERAALPWYVVHTYSGYEHRAKASLEERFRSKNILNKLGNILVPQETVVELVRGSKRTSNRKFFPGYILLQMDLDEETWHVVKDTPKVTGFVGDSRNPSPIPEHEVQALISQMEGGGQRPRPRVQFEEGDAIKVIDGPFAEFNGTVDEVKADKGKLRVLISIFGRNTPVELDFVQVEKV